MVLVHITRLFNVFFWQSFFICFLVLLVSSEQAIGQEKTVEKNWRDKVGVLKIGYLIQGDEKRQRQKLEPFRRALQRESRLKVAFKPVQTLSELISLQINRRIQYALHSASSYVMADVLCKCVEPVAVAKDQAGTNSLHAIIIAPFGGKVRALSDLKGRRLAIPEAPATLTRLLPLHALKQAGYDGDGEIGTLVNVTHPFEGFQKMNNNEADAFIGWSNLQGNLTDGYSRGTLQQVISLRKLAKSTDLRIVWRSKPVPNPPHVIRSDVPSELKTLLRDFLLTLHERDLLAYESISPGLTGGFSKIDKKDFEPLKALATYSINEQ